MSSNRMFSLLAKAALPLFCAGSVHAISITAGDIKFTIDNYDSGTTGYPTAAFDPDGAGVACGGTTANPGNIASCNAAGANPAPGALGTGADTMGIFSVANISRVSDGAVLWQKSAGDYLTGVFGSLFDFRAFVSCDGSECTVSTRSTGGYFALYQNSFDYDPTLGPTGAGVDLNDPGLYPGITGGSLYLSGEFVTGVAVGDFQSTYRSNFNSLTFAGAGQGFLEVTGGSAESTFDTNALIDANGVGRDLFLDVTFNDVDGLAAANGWTVTSAGQIKANAVPEPGSLLLAALALLGVGVASRRSRS